jgi:hypothetical protein
MTLRGKGWFIWQIPRCEEGAPPAIAAAQAAQLSHVLIKIAERYYPFGYDRAGRDLLPPVVEALHARGIAVWGWHYIYGEDPQREAQTGAQRARQLGLDGYVVDAETEFKRPQMADPARAFMQAVRAALPDMPLALSSYRFPSLHPQFPWSTFLEHCDAVMPQVYWEQAHNPDQQLVRTVNEFANPALVGYVRPVIPTGSAYGAGNWRATPEDITGFLAKAVALKLEGANLYSWDYARSEKNTDLWSAAQAFEWPTTPAPKDVPEQYVEALNSGDPAAVLKLYQPNAGHVTAKRTVVGLEDLSKWYVALLKDTLAGARFTLLEAAGTGNSRRFKWSAAGPRGTVLDGDDTIGLSEGKIQYHYTFFTLAPV